MDETERAGCRPLCTRIIELARVLDRRDADILIEELDSTLSQFEAELGETTPDLTESHTEELQGLYAESNNATPMGFHNRSRTISMPCRTSSTKCPTRSDNRHGSIL